MLDITLRPLGPQDEAAFYKSLMHWSGDDISYYSFIYSRNQKVTYADMLAELKREHDGAGLRPDRVPATMLYAFYGDQIIGRFHIRQRLNDYLLARGGNVGYAVAPNFRKKGVATEMMRLGLEYIRKNLKLEKILITCADSNVPSCRLIERYGGVLENKAWDEEHGEEIRRYWLKLTP